jgi:hypothetical protein
MEKRLRGKLYAYHLGVLSGCSALHSRGLILAKMESY